MSDPAVPRDEGVARVARLRTDVSHSARIWNYWLGGKDHYPVDEEVGDQILSFVPALPRSAVADRAFLARAVRYLAAEVGIRQFLDIGTGLPTADNTHEVAQRVDPRAGSSTSTTTPSSSPTRTPCSPARPKGPPTTSRPTSTTRRRSCGAPPRSSTSPSRSRSRCSA